MPLPRDLFDTLGDILLDYEIAFTVDDGYGYVNYRLAFTSKGITGEYYTYELNMETNQHEPHASGVLPERKPRTTTNAPKARKKK